MYYIFSQIIIKKKVKELYIIQKKSIYGKRIIDSNKKRIYKNNL